MSGKFVSQMLLTAFVISLGVCANAQLKEQQAKEIEAAVPEKATVEPGKPRCVLIWNTPFMDKCPHKGYSVPQGEYAMRMLGEKTGAFESVVSDDVVMYRKENLDKFDAIIMNNSNGPWIRPTPEDMDKFKDLGTDNEVKGTIGKGQSGNVTLEHDPGAVSPFSLLFHYLQGIPGGG